MAKNKITLDFEIQSDGSLKVIGKQAEKTAKSVDKVTKSTRRLSKAKTGLNVKHNTQHKLEKSLYQSNLSSAKGFSKQAQTIGGTLVPAYATLAANVFALTALFGALQRAAAFKQLEEGLIAVGAAAGQNLPIIAKGLKEITGAAISTEAAMSAVALGTSAGFTADQLERLTKVARGASLALGRNLEDALTRLVKGTAKLEPEILDELGIMVRLDDAVSKYAATIGKSATQLTQFERRQAFLTETLDQGLAKFGDISDSIDTNPYDKLAASFNDLTKSAFKMFNVALGPLVAFLSSTPSALIGAIILFGSTLVKSLIPAIDLTIQKQKAMAIQAAASARIVGAATKKAFLDISKNITFSAVTPKSIQSIAPELQKGTLSAKEMQKAIQNLRRSEELRNGWLKTYAVEGDKRTAKFIANKTKERDAIVRTRIEIERAVAAQKATLSAVGSERVARASSRISGRTAGALKLIDNAGLIKSFRLAGAAVGRNAKEVGKATKVFSKFAIAAKVAGSSVSLFGRALLNAIPIIGQVLFLGSLLIPLFKKMFGKDDLSKTIDDIVDSFKNLIEVGVKLEAFLISAKTSSEKFARSLKVQVGLINQVRNAFMLLQTSKLEGQSELLTATRKEIVRMEQLLSITTDPGFRAQLESQIALRETLLASIHKEVDLLDKEEGLTILKSFEDNLNAMPEIAQGALGEVRETLETLKKSVNEGTTFGVFLQALFKMSNEAERTSASIEGAQMAVSSFDKELNKIANKPTTIYDNLLEQAKGLLNELNQAGVKGGEGTDAFLERTPTLKKRLAELRESFKGLTDTNAMALIVAQLTVATWRLAELKGQTAKLAVQFKALNSVASDHPEIMERAVKAEQALWKIRVAAIDAELTVEKTVKNEEKRSKLVAERVALITKLANTEYEVEKVAQARAKQEQRLLGYSKTILTNSLKTLRTYQQMVTTIAKMQASAGNIDVSPITTAKIFKQQFKDKLTALRQEAVMRERSVKVEYNLLDAKLGLERVKAINAGATEEELAAYEGYADALKEGRLSAQAAAGAQSQSLQVALAVEGVEVTRAARNEEFRLDSEKLLNIAERLSNAGADNLAVEVELREQELKLTKLRKESQGLIMFSAEWLAKQLVIEKEITAEKAKQVEKSRILAERAERLGGEGMGIAASVGADILEKSAILNAKTGVPDADGTVINASDKIQAMQEITSSMVETLMSLGPDGEIMAAVTAGAFAMSEAFTLAFETMSKEGASSFDKIQAGLQAAGSMVNALANVMAASSRATIAGIDAQIDAEKKRDGKSSQSVAKILGLEKKKEKAKKKAFETDKKMKMAMTVINTAMAIMNVIATTVWPMNFILGGIVAAIGAMQLAAIAGTSYQGGGSAPAGPSAVSVGERKTTIDLAKSRSPSGELAYARGERGVGDGANNFIPGAFTGRATGGNTALRVGEQGTELFIPDRPGTIIPADDTEDILSGTTNVHFTINAIDATGIEELLQSKRGYMIEMIREAANSHGEFFLENVNTQDDTV